MTLTALAASVLGIGEAALSDTQTVFDWESEGSIDLLLAVEVAFDVQFSIREIRGMENLGDLRALLAEKSGDAALAA